MGILRRGFTLFLAVLMLISALPITAFAEEEEPGKEPESIVNPEPNPDPTPDTDPDPNPEPGPGPSPEPDPNPNPEPDPNPNPEPDPNPNPEPGPGPNPEPDPNPNPEPDPNPNPEPGPGPSPEPDPEPNPEPNPEPDPEPSPEPDPEPEPNPNPDENQNQNNDQTIVDEPQEIADILPADDVTVTDSSEDVSFSIRWCDNMDMDVRPGVPDADKIDGFLSSTFNLTYRITKEGKYYTIGEDGKLAEVGEDVYHKIEPNTGATVEDTDTDWKFTVPVTVPNLEDGYEIQYFVEQPEDVSVNGYKPITGGKHPVTDDPAIHETPYKPFTAYIDWLDGDNRYKTRPSDFKDTNLTLKRYLYGDAQHPETVSGYTPTLHEDGSITTPDLPQFNEEGVPYVYYLEPAVDENNKMQGPNQIDGTEQNQDGTLSKYEPTIKNEDDYGGETLRLHEGGTMEALLTNKDKITFKKVWKDDGDKSKRPAAKLLIYRTVVDDLTNLTDPGIFNKGIVNPGYDSAPVLVDGGDIVTGVGQDGQPDLPMYSPDGKRYIYYAFETGLSGDYQTVIDNSTASIKGDIREALGDNAEGQGYVLSGGTITNINKANYVQPPTKVFEAAALQSMKPEDASAETKVEVKLQSRPKNGPGGWEDYKMPKLDGDGNPVKDENGNVVMEPMTQTLTGFRPEIQTVTGSGVAVEKYDENGHEQEFRWVETSITVLGKSVVDVPIPENKDDTAFVWMNGLGDGETDVGFRIKRGDDGEIINNLRGVYEVKAKKNWTVYGLTYDPYSYELTVGEEKLNIKDEANADWAKEKLAAAIKAVNEENGTPITQEKANQQAADLYDTLIKEAQITQVRFEVLRDGKPLYRGSTGADDPNPQFGTYEELIAMKYTADQINKCDLNAQGANNWEAASQYPRFDDGGHAYQYELREDTTDVPNPWTTDGQVEYGKGVVEAVIEKEGSTRKIPQLTGSVTNVWGPGEDVLHFEVKKVWLDDTDVPTRKPVKVSVRHREGEGVGEALATATLDSDNNWSAHIAVAPAQVNGVADKVYDNYLILEDSVGEATVNYDKGYQHIVDHRNEINRDMFYANEGLDFTMVQDLRSGIIEDADKKLTHQYNVYIGRGRQVIDTEEGPSQEAAAPSVEFYTIYNQRTGYVDLKLSKMWVVGGDINSVRDVDFQIKVTGGSFEGERYLANAPTNPKLRFVATDQYIITNSGRPALFTLGKDDIVKENGEPVKYEYGDAKNAFKQESIDLNGGKDEDGNEVVGKLQKLRKYDTTGRLLSYEPVEAYIHVDGKKVSMMNQDEAVLVGTDYLTTSMKLTDTEYGPDHRSHDIYTYTAANIRKATVPIVLRKVWQDDGPTNRPDIYFTVYRCLASDFDKGDLNTGSELVTTLTDKSLWQTTGEGTNNWLWLCKLNDQDRYDAEGHPYVYFAVETINGDKRGYGTTYYNGEDITCLNSAGTDTQSTFNISYKELVAQPFRDETPEEGLPMLHPLSIVMDCRDGVPLDEEKAEGQRYYPAVTVNYRRDSRTVSGQKLWKMPQGQTSVNLPPFDSSLFVLNKAQSDYVKEHLNDELVARNSDGNGYTATLKKTGADGNEVDDVVKSIDQQRVTNTEMFHFPTNGGRLEKYDDFGRTQYYYIGEYMLPVEEWENPPDDGDPKLDISFSGNKKLVPYEQTVEIVNRFLPHAPYVEIKAEKTLKSGVNGITADQLTAPITFQLWCKAATGNDTDLMLAEVTVNWSQTDGYTLSGDSGVATVEAMDSEEDQRKFLLTFTHGKFNVEGSENEFDLLPRYGPDGLPYIYYVKEKVPNGYEGTSNGTTVKRTDSTTKTGFLATAKNFLFNLAGLDAKTAPDPWLSSDNVTLTPVEGNNELYTGKVEFTNTYWASKTESTDVTVTKNWKGDNGWASSYPDYRPDNVVLQLWRRNGEIEEPVTTNYKGTSIDEDTSDDKVTVTGNGSIALGADPTDTETPQRQVAKITITGMKNAASWSVTVNNLAKYAPDGKAYTYFVKEVDADNADGTGNKYENYDHSFSGTTATNTLEKVQVSMSKVWKGTLPDGSEVDIDEDKFLVLWHLGALPAKMSFQVESRPEPADDASPNKGWTSVPGCGESWTLDSEAAVKTAFNKMTSTAMKWSNLPKYVNSSKQTRLIQYRIVETMIWANGTTQTLDYDPDITDNPQTNNGSSITQEVTEENNGYRYEFVNTIPVRQLEVHKYWADGNNQDGIRPDLSITVTRDTNAGTYTFDIPSGNDEHNAPAKIYVPLYKNGFNQPGENGANISLYTAAETMTGTYDQHYSPLAQVTEQGKTLYGALDSTYTIDADKGEGFLNGTAAKCVERQTDKNATVFSSLTGTFNNQFVFANEQVTRKRLNLTAEKVWPTDPLDASQPTEIYLQLQYQQDNQWIAADKHLDEKGDIVDGSGCGLANDTATHSLTGSPWKTEWEEVYANKTGGPGASRIQYRVVEMLKNADGSYTEIRDNTAFPYTWTWSGFKGVNPLIFGSDEMLTEESGRITNTLKTVSLRIGKQFEGTYAGYLLPESVSFRLWYKANGAQAWAPCPLAGEDGVFTLDKSASYFRNFENLPKFDRQNNPIQYAVSEVPVDGSREAAPDKDGNWSGNAGAFNGEASIALAGDGNWSVVAKNTLPVTNVSVTKIWDDEYNRDGLRGAITLQLNRDNAKFLTVTYDPSKPSNKRLTVKDMNGKTIANPPVNVAESLTAEGAAVWVFTFDDLPMYKNQAVGRGEDDKSVYTMVEAGKPDGYTSNVDGLTVTNTHAPETFQLTAQKDWNDENNKYGLRPGQVTFELEYWDIAAGKWTLITQDTLPYDDATGVYTTSKPSVTITPDAAGQWTKTAVWQNLRKLVWVDGEPQTIQYRVVEKLPAYEGIAKYNPPTPVTVRTPLESDNVTATVTNSLVGAKALTVVKEWNDWDNAYATRPDSIQVQLQYSTDDGESWNPVPGNGTENMTDAKLTEEGNWTVDFTGLRNDYMYRVVEISITYKGSEPVPVDKDTHIVGAYMNDTYDVELLEDVEATQGTLLVNTLLTTSLPVTKAWEGDSDYVADYRPASITVQLQRRVKSQAKSLGEKLESLYTYDGWENVVMSNGEKYTAEVNPDADGKWSCSFDDLPKYDNSGNVLEYRAIEIKMTMKDGSEISISEKHRPYDAAVHGNVITNTFRTVTLELTKHWEDFHNLYGARPENIKLTVKDQNELEYRNAEVKWRSQDSDTSSWKAEISNLPMYLPDGKTKAVYTITEAVIEDAHGQRYEADETVLNRNGEYHLTNRLVMGKGDVTLTKFGSRVDGVKLAGAVYRLVRLDESGIPTYYTGQDDPAWTYLPGGAAKLTTDKNGTLTLTGLPYGRYRFEEVKAPSGYSLNKKPVEFTIDASNQNTKLEVHQVDAKVSQNPRTGDDIFKAAAVMLTSAAALTGLILLRKKRKK